MDLARKEASEKAQECNMLQQRVGVLAVVEAQHGELTVRLKVNLPFSCNHFVRHALVRMEPYSSLTDQIGLS